MRIYTRIRMRIRRRLRRGVTLIELFIVTAIVTTLGVAAFAVLSPAELLRQGRDGVRLTDLDSVSKALAVYQSDTSAPNFGEVGKVYVSIPDSSPGCVNLSLPPLPSGYEYACVPTSTLHSVDGTGWVPVAFTSHAAGSPLEKLPVDPTNAVSVGLYYTYIPSATSFELTAFPESAKYRMGGPKDAASLDGGSFPELIERGTALSLNPVSRDPYLVGYWPLDEGSGLVAYDHSGKANTGSLVNGPSWISGCQVGGCLSFDGTNDYVNFGNASSLQLTNALSMVAWVRLDDTRSRQSIMSKGNGYKLALAEDAKMETAAAVDGAALLTSEASGGTTLTPGVWYQIIGTYDGKLLTTYVNGVLDRSIEADGDVENNIYSLMLGKSSDDTGEYYSGRIDEVRVYSKALSGSEVQAIYASSH